MNEETTINIAPYRIKTTSVLEPGAHPRSVLLRNNAGMESGYGNNDLSIQSWWVVNGTVLNFTTLNDAAFQYPLTLLVPTTVCYIVIFIAGILGNVVTCIIINKNKSMHTATNYYLFNLAISDLLLLISGMPLDLYNMWIPYQYPFSSAVCMLLGMISETTANATVLTITSFTVERYIAICHPFRQHMMDLSRAIKFIFAIWVVSFCLAIPQFIQIGVVQEFDTYTCTVSPLWGVCHIIIIQRHRNCSHIEMETTHQQQLPTHFATWYPYDEWPLELEVTEKIGWPVT